VLQANVLPVNPNTTYQWYRDGALIPNANQSTYTVDEPARGSAYAYYVAVNQLPGCSPASKTIKVNVLFDIPTTDYWAYLCPGGTYRDNNFTNLTEAGVYCKTLQSVHGCDSTVCLTLEEGPSPAPDMNLTRLDNSFVVTWQTSGTYLASYHLYRNNEWLATVGTTSYTDNDLTDGVTYCYKIRAIDGDRENELCGEICEMFNTVGIAETRHATSLRVYPNPAKNELTIDNGQLTIDNVEIYSIVGQKVGTYGIRPDGIRPDETTIDVSHLAQGMYFLKVGNKVVKFVKQ